MSGTMCECTSGLCYCRNQSSIERATTRVGGLQQFGQATGDAPWVLRDQKLNGKSKRKSLRAKATLGGVTVAMLGTTLGLLGSPASAIPDDGNRGQEGSVGAPSDCNCGEPNGKSDNDSDRDKDKDKEETEADRREANYQRIEDNMAALTFTPHQEAVVDQVLAETGYPNTPRNRAIAQHNLVNDAEHLPPELRDDFHNGDGGGDDPEPEATGTSPMLTPAQQQALTQMPPSTADANAAQALLNEQEIQDAQQPAPSMFPIGGPDDNVTPLPAGSITQAARPLLTFTELLAALRIGAPAATGLGAGVVGVMVPTDAGGPTITELDDGFSIFQDPSTPPTILHNGQPTGINVTLGPDGSPDFATEEDREDFAQLIADGSASEPPMADDGNTLTLNPNSLPVVVIDPFEVEHIDLTEQDLAEQPINNLDANADGGQPQLEGTPANSGELPPLEGTPNAAPELPPLEGTPGDPVETAQLPGNSIIDEGSDNETLPPDSPPPSSSDDYIFYSKIYSPAEIQEVVLELSAKYPQYSEDRIREFLTEANLKGNQVTNSSVEEARAFLGAHAAGIYGGGVLEPSTDGRYDVGLRQLDGTLTPIDVKSYRDHTDLTEKLAQAGNDIAVGEDILFNVENMSPAKIEELQQKLDKKPKFQGRYEIYPKPASKVRSAPEKVVDGYIDGYKVKQHDGMVTITDSAGAILRYEPVGSDKINQFLTDHGLTIDAQPATPAPPETVAETKPATPQCSDDPDAAGCTKPVANIDSGNNTENREIADSGYKVKQHDGMVTITDSAGTVLRYEPVGSDKINQFLNDHGLTIDAQPATPAPPETVAETKPATPQCSDDPDAAGCTKPVANADSGNNTENREIADSGYNVKQHDGMVTITDSAGTVLRYEPVGSDKINQFLNDHGLQPA